MFALPIDFIFFLLAAVAPVSYGQWIAAVFYGMSCFASVVFHNYWKSLAVAVAAAAGLYFASPLHGAIMCRF